MAIPSQGRENRQECSDGPFFQNTKKPNLKENYVDFKAARKDGAGANWDLFKTWSLYTPGWD